ESRVFRGRRLPDPDNLVARTLRSERAQGGFGVSLNTGPTENQAVLVAEACPKQVASRPCRVEEAGHGRLGIGTEKRQQEVRVHQVHVLRQVDVLDAAELRGNAALVDFRLDELKTTVIHVDRVNLPPTGSQKGAGGGAGL